MRRTCIAYLTSEGSDEQMMPAYMLLILRLVAKNGTICCKIRSNLLKCLKKRFDTEKSFENDITFY